MTNKSLYVSRITLQTIRLFLASNYKNNEITLQKSLGK